jgi:hypothetical protein
VGQVCLVQLDPYLIASFAETQLDLSGDKCLFSNSRVPGAWLSNPMAEPQLQDKGRSSRGCNPAFFALSASPLFLSINPRNLSEPTFSAVRLSLLLLLVIISSLFSLPSSSTFFSSSIIFLSLSSPFLSLFSPFLLIPFPSASPPPLVYPDAFTRQLMPRALAADPKHR